MRTAFFLLIFLLLTSRCWAGQSVIVESVGYACMGEVLSRKQTESLSLADAQRAAAEKALTYIRGESLVRSFMLEKDVVAAYSHAAVRLIDELERLWYVDQVSGSCIKTRIKAEVTPDYAALENVAKDVLADDPTAPLQVRLWTDKKNYLEGETIKVYLRANKPFYARVVYQDVAGNLIQILPSPYRQEGYFNGGFTYEIPGPDDQFEISVSPPLGKELIRAYASTAPLGAVLLVENAGIYLVESSVYEVNRGSRSVSLVNHREGSAPKAAEFDEVAVNLNTGE